MSTAYSRVSLPEVSRRSLLLVEDDPGMQKQMKWALANEFSVTVAGNRSEALKFAERDRSAVVILDLGLPPDSSGASEGLATLEALTAACPNRKVIIASGNEDRSIAQKAVAMGAYDFFNKPADVEQLKVILERAWRLCDLESDATARIAPKPLIGIVGSSPAVMTIRGLVERVGPSNANVLILGESGTGKELLAQGLHGTSKRAKGPFVAINCAAIPDALLESELFGYERGAFTGAVKQTRGVVETANGGTLFLDEIGDMPAVLQVKLLRFLQTRCFRRLGGHDEIAVDVRFIAASNRNLAQMMRAGTFREDLFYRLNEVSIEVPPLRARGADAVEIAEALLQPHAAALRKRTMSFSPGALSAIGGYSWPGNVRELENRVKRAVILSSGRMICPKDLGFTGEPAPTESSMTLAMGRRKGESEAIRSALGLCRNNRSQAARMLGISRKTLYHLMGMQAGHTEA